MPSSLSLLPAQARRSLTQDVKEDKEGWLQVDMPALAVSFLGLSIAGSSTGSTRRHHRLGHRRHGGPEIRPPRLTAVNH